MAFIQGEGRTQGTLFPVALDDLIPADHVCRVIDAFVGRLDMEQLGFIRAEAAEVGVLADAVVAQGCGACCLEDTGRPRRSTIASTAGVRREFGRASSRRRPNLLNRRNEWLSTARMSKRIAALAAEKGGVGTGDWHHQGRAQQQDSRPCR